MCMSSMTLALYFTVKCIEDVLSSCKSPRTGCYFFAKFQARIRSGRIAAIMGGII